MRKIVTDLDVRGNLTVGGQPVSGGSGGSVPSYTVDLGAVTANTPVVVTHNLGTFDVLVSIVEKDTAAAGGGTGEVVASTITVDTANQISITFAADAAADLYRVIVVGAGSGAATATGGLITEAGGYRIHTFTSDGTFNVTGAALTVEVLVVAGGGGGGSGYNGGGGGGGAIATGTTLVDVGAHTVTVGAGGATDTAGSNSSFGAYMTAAGGGEGGSRGQVGGNGGTGGGAGGDSGSQRAGGVGNPGYDGGLSPAANSWASGGGGSMAAAGEDGATVAGHSGAGADGLASSISGSPVTYGAGGGGGGDNAPFAPGAGGAGGGGNGGTTTGFPGAANTGGGGGGAGGDGQAGGVGGSGIVIVRYLMDPSPEVPAGGTTGQVLAKASGTDFDTAWVDAAAGTAGRAVSTSTTSVSSGTWTQVGVQNGSATGDLSYASSAFTVATGGAGWYVIHVAVSFNSGTNSTVYIKPAVNGTKIDCVRHTGVSVSDIRQGSVLVELAASDVVTMEVYIPAAMTVGGNVQTYLQLFKVA